MEHLGFRFINFLFTILFIFNGGFSNAWVLDIFFDNVKICEYWKHLLQLFLLQRVKFFHHLLFMILNLFLITFVFVIKFECLQLLFIEWILIIRIFCPVRAIMTILEIIKLTTTHIGTRHFMSATILASMSFSFYRCQPILKFQIYFCHLYPQSVE